MYTLNPLFNNTIGSRMGLSFKDALLVHLKYCAGSQTTNGTLTTSHPISAQCNDSSVAAELHCERGGFPTADCRHCVCPDGFSGDACQFSDSSTDSSAEVNVFQTLFMEVGCNFAFLSFRSPLPMAQSAVAPCGCLNPTNIFISPPRSTTVKSARSVCWPRKAVRCV